MYHVTELSDFNRCKRLYYYSRIAQLEPIEPYIPFLTGTEVHLAKETFYKTKSKEKALAVVTEHYDKVTKESFIPPEKTPDYEQAYYSTLGMAEGYINVYGESDLEKWKEILPEKEFKDLDLGDHVKVSGKIDTLVLDQDSRWWIEETKTTAKLSKDYFEMLTMNPQLCLYQVAGKKMFHRSIVGVIFNVIRKPTIRRKKSETWNQYLERLIKDLKDPERKDFYFVRQWIRYSQTDVDRAIVDIKNTVKWLVVMKTEWEHEENPALKGSAFWARDGYYNKCSKEFCPYKPLCRYGERKDILRLFKKKEVSK